MTQESAFPAEQPAESGAKPKIPGPIEAFTDEELDALEQLAAFETEHRRMLAMQSLYYRRHGARGIA